MDVTTSWFAERLSEQTIAHSGAVLRGWAEQVVAQLPEGRVTLVSSSVEGCVLAGVVAALRHEPTVWEQLALGRPQPDRSDVVVVVEPLLLGEGMMEMLGALLPSAMMIHGLAAGWSGETPCASALVV